MSNYTGSVPDTRRRLDWRARAVCQDDPDAMFPDNNTTGIAYAKAVCSACPVSTSCLIDALAADDNEYGIRGGLKPDERRAVRKITGDEYTRPETLDAAIMQVLHPATASQTLRDVWDAHTRDLPGGHIAWQGTTTPLFQGRVFTPKQIAFRIDRGHEPVGIVRRTPECPVVECVHPRHLADNKERYERKVAAEEEASRAAVRAQYAAGEIAS